MIPKLILLFFSFLALTGLAQNDITSKGNDTVVFLNQIKLLIILI